MKFPGMGKHGHQEFLKLVEALEFAEAYGSDLG